METSSMNPWGCRCWLLTSPRSGSTYLQYLLNHNAGVPLRPDSENRESARFSFGEHMSQVFCTSLEDFLQWDPVVSKVHCHHFGAYLIDRPLLKARMPPVRFVLLERIDRVAQAVSLAMSNRTGVTQCKSCEAQDRFHATSVSLTDESLLECYRAVGDYRDFWRNWLHSEPHLTVTYESLIEEPRDTLAKILDYLRTPYRGISLDVPLMKLEHPQTAPHVSRLEQLVG